VSKVFGRGAAAVQALDQVSLEVAPGEFTCLIGASGCGKSTLLSLVAGLEQPTAGEVSTVKGGGEVGGGQVAFMFQEPALFPWLTAAGNVEVALRASAVSAPASCSRRCTWAGSAPSARTSSPVACGSGSRWPARWPRTPTCC
jgi:ABC-type nitrate/sulfonate/bicarbonate transport system ATPase subunit